MSARNGNRSRHNINRKRTLHMRMKMREVMADLANKSEAETAAPAKTKAPRARKPAAAAAEEK